MSESALLPALFRSQAELVIKTFADEFRVPLAYNADGVEQISTYIDLIRDIVRKDQIEETITSLGAFIGETLIRELNGRWTDAGGWWGVELASGVVACPFVQIRNQFVVGESQSVSRYFVCLQELANRLSLVQKEKLQSESIIRQLRSELDIWLNTVHLQEAAEHPATEANSFATADVPRREAV